MTISRCSLDIVLFDVPETLNQSYNNAILSETGYCKLLTPRNATCLGNLTIECVPREITRYRSQWTARINTNGFRYLPMKRLYPPDQAPRSHDSDLKRLATMPRGKVCWVSAHYEPPSVESERGSLDSLDGLEPDSEDAVRREMQQMDIEDPLSDTSSNRSLPALSLLEAFLRPYKFVSLSHTSTPQTMDTLL